MSGVHRIELPTIEEQRDRVGALEDCVHPHPDQRGAELNPELHASLARHLEEEREPLRRMEAEEKTRNE